MKGNASSGGVKAAVAAPTAGARTSLALLLLINLFNYIDRSVLSAVEGPIRAEFFSADDPNSKAWTGALATAFLVSYMVAAPLFGWAADRGRRWVIVGAGVLVWTVASGGSGLAVTFTMLALTRVFVGIGEAAYGPVAPAIISDMYPVARRGSVLAWFYMAIPVGSALGYALGGWIGHQYGWRWAFYAVVPPGIVLALLAFARRDPPRGASDPGTAPGRRISVADLKTLLRTPSYVLNVAGMTAMTFAIGGVAFWMPTYIEEFRGIKSVAVAGIGVPGSVVFGVITVITGFAATFAGGWAGDRLRGRFGGSYLLVSGFAMLAGFPLFLLVMVAPFPACWFVMLAAVFCLFFNTGPSNTAIANVSHPAMRASAYALCIFVIHALGDAISPPLIGIVTGACGGNMNAGFGLVSAAVLLAGFFWLWGARYLARDTALASTRVA